MDNYLVSVYSNYFNTLFKTGYISDAKIESLLVVEFIFKLMTGEFGRYLNSKEYNKVDIALTCLLGKSCLLPYIDYLRQSITEVTGGAALSSISNIGEPVGNDPAGEVEDNILQIEKQLDIVHKIKTIKSRDYIVSVPEIKIIDY